jgi:hypothetical protein
LLGALPGAQNAVSGGVPFTANVLTPDGTPLALRALFAGERAFILRDLQGASAPGTVVGCGVTRLVTPPSTGNAGLTPRATAVATVLLAVSAAGLSFLARRAVRHAE